ncbi:MAG: hypothetical protein HYZ14_06860 [Bacteroidetes bacterium]|nr:hypothetical protein [Bacteroidota bacterium]
MKKNFAILIFVSSTTFGQSGFVDEKKFQDYIPISPIEYKGIIEIYSRDSSGKMHVDTSSIKVLSAFKDGKEEILKLIPHYGMSLTIKTNTTEGGLKFATNALSAKKNSYEMVFDFTAYSSQPIYDNKKQIIATGKLGVTTRLKANIITKSKNLNLSDLFQIGIYASQEKLTGTLSIEIIGISSPEIVAMIPVPAELNVTSVQSSLQSLAAIKAKIFDESTRLHPQILAIRPETTTNTILEILNIYKSNPSSVEDLKMNIQQQQLQQQLFFNNQQQQQKQ